MTPADQNIVLAKQHIDRMAYHVRDNPFLREIAATEISDSSLETLRNFLAGHLTAKEWLDSGQASKVIGEISVGCVPRDVQLVLRGREQQVGVESVYAFVDAPNFWWVVSMLWCMEVGRYLDKLLDKEIYGWRLHEQFMDDPASGAQVFKNISRSHSSWKNAARKISESDPDRIFSVATIDMKSFFYSIRASPSKIIDNYLSSTVSDYRMSPVGRELTTLLDAAHLRYAEENRKIKPRGEIGDDTIPLPIGMPSSQILANLVMAQAVREIRQNENVAGVAVYADDIVIVTPILQEMGENTDDFFERLGVVLPGEAALQVGKNVSELATFEVGFSKSDVSYGRARSSESISESEEGISSEVFDVQVGSTPSTDWGGRLRTVLRSPFRRDRVPQELRKDINRLVEEIRLGLGNAEAISSFGKLVGDLDKGSFIALRSSWTELLSCATFAGGLDPIESLCVKFSETITSLAPPSEGNQLLAQSIAEGLQKSWAQALAEALSVTDRAGRDLAGSESEAISSATGVSVESILVRSETLRSTSFIDSNLVSMPLSEFSDWEGNLFGYSGFEKFRSMQRSNPFETRMEDVSDGLKRCKRFVPLHEICIALHLWISADSEGWVNRLFELFSIQPLLNRSLVLEIQAKSAQILGFEKRNDRAEELDDYLIRIAVPSLEVDGAQLDALVSENHSLTSEIMRTSRQGLRSVVKGSVKRKADAIVLPEWSVQTCHLPWLFSVGAENQMLIVAGEGPSVVDSIYSNKVWTGIPLVDSAGHRACLVPPPREKRHLSPAERALVSKSSLHHSPSSESIPQYSWRGIRLASLICFEFADINSRTELREGVDLLTVSSWNMDWRYFSAVQESTTRDNYCVTVCVNTGQFPGTQIMRPTKSDRSIAAAVHGSGDPTVVTRVVDFLPVVIARTSGLKPSEIVGCPKSRDGLELNDYKALPPTFAVGSPY